MSVFQPRRKKYTSQREYSGILLVVPQYSCLDVGTGSVGRGNTVFSVVSLYSYKITLYEFDFCCSSRLMIR